MLADIISIWLKETNKRDWIIESQRRMLAFWSPIEEIYWNLYRIEETELSPVWPFIGIYESDKLLVDTIHISDPNFFFKLDKAIDIAAPTIRRLRELG